MNYRSILNKWKEILSNHEDVNKFSLEKFLGSEREQLQWQSEGLSADQLSLQNAVIILKVNDPIITFLIFKLWIIYFRQKYLPYY